MKEIYVQYGCGLSAPKEWNNFDSSLTLRLQKIPIIGKILKKRNNVIFPENVKYGDIIKGLPVKENSCLGVFCSHVLEHLALEDFRKALNNTYKILKKGGIFRFIVPDLEICAREYIQRLERGEKDALIKFLGPDTLLGTEKRLRGIRGIIYFLFSNKNHLWMWDHNSLVAELEQAGFIEIRKCYYNDSEDKMFQFVENQYRYINSLAMECRK